VHVCIVYARGPWPLLSKLVRPHVWGEAQLIAYKYILLTFELIEQPFPNSY
jgi:hypothetical protein